MSSWKCRVAVVAFVLACARTAAASPLVAYAAYASTTPAFKTDFRFGYTDTRGFVGNSAKTQVMSMLVAYHSYSDAQTARDELWKSGLVLRSTYSVGMGLADAQAIVVDDVRGSAVLVGLRGTSGFQDGLTDLYFAPTLLTRNGVDMHKGFANYVDAIFDQVRAELAPDCTGAGKSIWVSGHSLGGAAATILAARLERSGCHVSGVSTFGSPRAGLQSWLTEYRSASPAADDLYYRTQRWVHDKDPFYCAAPGGKWTHVGIEGLLSDPAQRVIPNRFFGSSCENPTGWLAGIRDTIRASPEASTFRFSAAADAWIAGKVNILFQCQSGFGWDDVWSLGVCFLNDSNNALESSFGISPDELITEIFRFTNIKDHWKDKYISLLTSSVNFDDPSFSYRTPTVIITGPAAN